MHPIDLLWGVLSVAGAAAPAYRLYDNLHRPGARYFLGLVIVCALYPWAYIVHRYTPLDQAVVIAFTAWIGPLYLLGVFSYLNVRPPGWSWLRNGMLLYGIGMSLFALSNPLHGQFATYLDPVPTQPLSTSGWGAHGAGLTIMGGVSIACIIATVMLIGFYYSRSRFRFSSLLTMTLFPVASGCAYLLQDPIRHVVSESINTFILCTSAGLWMLTYSLLRGRFLELRPIAREVVLNLIPDAMAVVGSKGTVLDCNTQFARLLGRPIRAVVGAELRGRLPEQAWTLNGQPKSTRTLQLDLDSVSRFFQVHLVGLEQRDDHGDVLVLLRDVTEQTLAHETLQAHQAELQALNDELARLSSTDTLTGLRNRRHFLHQLSLQFERAARHFRCFALLSIDLDNFKSINDNHGHAAGDEALVHAARAMESQCRAVDALARVGGEEFMVLLLDIDEAGLGAVAERFRRAVEEACVVLGNGVRLTLTVSIGGALLSPEDTMQSALRQIDDALYQAKRAGRNRVVLSRRKTTASGPPALRA